MKKYSINCKNDSTEIVKTILGYYEELIEIEKRIHQIMEQVDMLARKFDEYGPRFSSKYTLSEDIAEIKSILKKIENQ